MRILHSESALLGSRKSLLISLPRRRQRRHACAGADAALHQPDPPYYYPRHYVGTTDAAIRDLSRTALENTLSILHALEQAHQEQFSTALTLRRLGEALYRPRLPDRGRSLRYDLSLPASACLEDDLLRLDRIRMRGGMIHGA